MLRRKSDDPNPLIDRPGYLAHVAAREPRFQQWFVRSRQPRVAVSPPRRRSGNPTFIGQSRLCCSYKSVTFDRGIRNG
jgi:hypothetical protein